MLGRREFWFLVFVQTRSESRHEMQIVDEPDLLSVYKQNERREAGKRYSKVWLLRKR